MDIKFLKKEIVIKKSIGATIIEATIFALVFTFIVYLLLSKYNSIMIKAFNSIVEGKASAFEFTTIIFPMILIISLMIAFGTLVTYSNKK